MTFDGSNRKQVREREKELKLAEANRHAYVRRIMQDKPGRKWMHDLLEKCCIFQTPFVAGAPDVTARNCGYQDVGLSIFSDVVNAAPAEYVQMMSEASEKELVHERRYSDDRSPAAEHTGSEDPGRDVEGRDPVTEYDPYAGTEA
jgi:hypothetical protein